MRTIRVTGKGQIKVKHDMTRITLTLTGLHKEYDETLRRSAEDTEALRAALVPLGFEPSDLKTLRFDVDAEYESCREENEYKQRFAGYRFRHRMKVEFDSDNRRLGRVLCVLANSPVRPEFRISYTVRDPESAKNTLLGKAVADAAEKAAVLTRAAGTACKEIQSIDYSWGEIRFESEPVRFDAAEKVCMSDMAAADSFDVDIEPDDIEVTDTVTVMWEIG